MCEEYLSSKEIMQKIADLKIRLALQQEFEQEVKAVEYHSPTYPYFLYSGQTGCITFYYNRPKRK